METATATDAPTVVDENELAKEKEALRFKRATEVVKNHKLLHAMIASAPASDTTWMMIRSCFSITLNERPLTTEAWVNALATAIIGAVDGKVKGYTPHFKELVALFCVSTGVPSPKGGLAAPPIPRDGRGGTDVYVDAYITERGTCCYTGCRSFSGYLTIPNQVIVEGDDDVREWIDDYVSEHARMRLEGHNDYDSEERLRTNIEYNPRSEDQFMQAAGRPDGDFDEYRND